MCVKREGEQSHSVSLAQLKYWWKVGEGSVW